MRRLRWRRAATALVIAALVPVAIAGCVQSGSSGSRATLYDSVDGLARDSSVIVVGSVEAQREVTSADTGTITISTVNVANTPANPALGENLDTEAIPVAVGDSVEIRQFAGAGILRLGNEYLLFLTPSMLPGEEAAHFYITGAVAGAYQRDGSEFRRLVPESGDELPTTISIAGEPD